MPTRYWNFNRRGGIPWDTVIGLEDSIVFLSTSDSADGGLEEESERCFRKRKGMRMS